MLRPSRDSRRHGSEETGSANAADYIDSQIFDFSGSGSLPATSLPGMTKSHRSFTVDELASQRNLAWPHVDLLMTMPVLAGNESRLPQPSLASQNCTCNSTTGPCADHLEDIRTQVLAGTTSLPLHQQHQNHHALNSDMYIPHQYSQIRPSRNNSYRSSPPTPSYLSPAALAAVPPDSFSADAKFTASAAAADITRRFGVVLEAMRAVGFQDFDGMAVAYYTAQFEKGSFLAMTQCASRSRRLKAMLKEVQRSSSRWPRWESRGLDEGVLEATVALCVEEIEHLKKAQGLNLARGEPAHIISAFERLLSDHGCSIEREYRGYAGVDAEDSSMLEELTLWGQMEALPDANC
ncbi:hypothetical protein F5884DRAFT_835742 [Xylogone sp. PMI_703]|nr:hypothetical protein F5884DRAFT_835742 [Xylogone sp. PMI_703]